MPKVSIIIPVYNTEIYLTKCIESALNQTLGEVEVILIDDGSTDNSGMICDQYKHKANMKIIHQENRGLSAARNRGLDVAEGDYVAFLDSDDYIAPEMYSELYTIAEQEKVDIVYSNYAVVEGNRLVADGETYLPPNRRIEPAEIRNIAITERSYRVLWFVWKGIFRKDFLVSNSIRFIEGSIIEDTPFNLDALLSAKAVWFVNKPFYYYVQTPNSLVRSIYRKHFCEKIDNCYKARKSISDKHELKNYFDNLATYNIKHSLVELLTNEIHNPGSFFERRAELKRIRVSEVAQETLMNKSVFLIHSNIKYIMLLLKWKCYTLITMVFSIIR